MKTGTKIFFIIFIISMIGVIFTAKFLISAINIIDGNIVVNMSTIAWVGVGFNILNIFSGNVLFVRFLKTRKLNTMLFFATVPLGLIFAGIAFLLAGINNFSGQTFSIVRTALNINVANYNNYLWLGVIAIVYVVLMFFTFMILTLPVKKVEIATKRLAYGEVSSKINIGGNKQFLEIENSLNKINQNYKQNNEIVGQATSARKKMLPRQLAKYIGKENIKKLENGESIKKVVTMLYCSINLEFIKEAFDIKDSLKVMQNYLKFVVPIIQKKGGFVDRYTDDGLFCVFSNSQVALNCAMEINNIFSQKNLKNNDFKVFNFGMCLHTAEMGFRIENSNDKNSLTVISDCLSIFNKLDDINKLFGSTLIFTKDTLNDLPSSFRLSYRFVGNTTVGDEINMPVFECLEVYSKSKKEKLNKCHILFENAVRSYLNFKFVEAKDLFEKVYKIEKDDKVCYTYYNKCCESLSKILQ